MNTLITIAALVVVTLLLVFFAGCRRPRDVDKSQLPSPDGPYVKVHVGKSGEITLDGKAATVEEVGSAFASLAQRKGVVLYSRESPGGAEPHPNAARVIELLTRNGLPVRLCMSKDCSEVLLQERGWTCANLGIRTGILKSLRIVSC